MLLNYYLLTVTVYYYSNKKLRAFSFPVYSDLNYILLQCINVDVLESKTKNHPDRALVNFVLDGFHYGFKLGLAQDPKPRGPCKNSKTVQQYPEIAQELVDKEVQRGHILGPFDDPPLEKLCYSPIGLVKKACSPEGSFRLIQDLSFPYHEPEESINACIPEEESLVQYHYLEEVIQMALDIGSSAVACRLDVRHAFHNLGVHPSQIWLLAFSLNGKTYLNVSVPFGGASSCLLWEKVATVLQWMIQHERNAEWLSHFLDDNIMLEKTIQALMHLKDEFEHIFDEIGMTLAADPLTLLSI